MVLGLHSRTVSIIGSVLLKACDTQVEHDGLMHGGGDGAGGDGGSIGLGGGGYGGGDGGGGEGGEAGEGGGGDVHDFPHM